MLEKLKQYYQYVVGFLFIILTGAFLFERSKRKSAEAIADNKEMLDKINEGDKQLSANSGQLQSEEVKREEVRKATEDAKSDDSGDATDFLNKR